MVLHTFSAHAMSEVTAEPLSPEAFAPFGGVISADHQIKNTPSSAANYGTAVKIHDVAPIIADFAKCPSGVPAVAKWNIFRCSAPNHLIQAKSVSKYTYCAKVLERHPFSSQTFVPMGQEASKLSYIVIVAKSNESSTEKLPDLSTVKAFICKGNQSVTYGAGIWHAPMVVIDDQCSHIDFAVFIHENGISDEDCQECYFEPGFNVQYEHAARAKL